MSEDDIPKLSPNDVASFRLRIYNLEKRSKKLSEAAQKLYEEIEALSLAVMFSYTPGDPGSTKRSDGRLTEAGVRAVEAAFEAGAKVTEVARDFLISPSAASTRRKVWLASKGSSSQTKPPKPQKKVSRTPPTDP